MARGIYNSYEHTQSSASTTWTITHNLNLSNPVVDVFIDNAGSFEKVVPSSIVVTSSNVVTVTLSSSQSGRALVT